MTSPVPPSDVSPLQVLGFSARQERLYRIILRNPDSTVYRLAGLAGLSVFEIREQVARLAGSGVVALSGDQREVVVARPPQEGLARLVTEEVRRVHSRREQLDAVRDLLPSLAADHLVGIAPRGEQFTVETLAGADVPRLMRSLTVASDGDLLWLRPDPGNVVPGEELDDWVVDRLRDGRGSRAIYRVEVLQDLPRTLRRRAAAGEEVRVLAEVPTRLAVLGHSAALVAEQFAVLTDRRMVLRHPSLVAALALLFEQLWERATPVAGMGGGPHHTSGPRPGLPGSGLAADRRLLVEQLAAGAKDEQIARALDLSLRTVRRRVAELLRELDAGSRFQAGVEAARRGWL